MVKHRTHLAGVTSEAWAVSTICPGCGSCKLLRADTGTCEPCAAKTAAARKAWEQMRGRALGSYRPISRIDPLTREPFCLICDEPLDGRSESEHRSFYCVARKFSCGECGQRFYLSSERAQHRRRVHGASY